MNPTLGRGLSTSASKRARSTDSQRSLSNPDPKASRTENEDEQEQESQDDTSVPAFLRQSKAEIHTKFEELEWQQQLRIAHGRSDPSSKWVQESTSQVKLRNRYLNVQPWEKSRVHLNVAEGQCDYINASPISLKDPRRNIETVYIATQGPKPAGLSHFWQMVWQETADIAVIVMLTQTAESGREKCHQYFPLDVEGEAFSLDPIDEKDAATNTAKGSIKLLEAEFDEKSRSTIRKLLLTYGEKSKTVWHLLYGGWPDFAVPEDENCAALLELIKISNEKNPIATNPRIIHCSAGVGRSGTFIALEYLLTQLDSGALEGSKDEEDMMYDVVNRLREQRMTMVQSEVQYQFLYQVVREQLLKKKATAAAAAGNGEPSPKLRKTASTAFFGAGREGSDAGIAIGTSKELKQDDGITPGAS